jgi:hypothetical protein
MTVHDDLATAQRALTELERAVRALKLHFGPSLDMRRLEEDVSRISSDVALLTETAPPAGAGARRTLEVIPEEDYDRSLWQDADDEGLGGLH